MIPRADFALEDDKATSSSDNFHSISVKDLKSDGILRPILGNLIFREKQIIGRQNKLFRSSNAS